MSTPALRCEAVVVRYGPTAAITGVDLVVEPGELVALLGPSGSGKTTLLHAIAGFVPISEGEIAIQGRPVSTPTASTPPEDRLVGVVFQHHALWPHLSARQTIEFPLRGRSDATSEARGLLEALGIGDLAERHPDQLSGGEQQRVSLGRALARRPAVFLLDEPTAHLDAPLRTTLLELIDEHRRRLEAATLYATHDATEALAVADRVVLLRSGEVVQIGTPRHVYEEPVDRWAAEMTGPVSELLVGIATVSETRIRLALPAGGHEVQSSGMGDVPLVRPEWATLPGPLDGKVQHIAYRGARTEYRLETGAGRVLVSEPGPPRFEVGAAPGWDLHRVHLVSRR